MAKDTFSRREFVGIGAAVAGATLIGEPALPIPGPLARAERVAPASERVRFGMIGIGMQGNSLLATSITLPDVECAAACDLYDGRHVLAREIVRANLPVTRRYQELLDNKDIDCIVAAVPDHWHRQIVVDAVSAASPDLVSSASPPFQEFRYAGGVTGGLAGGGGADVGGADLHLLLRAADRVRGDVRAGDRC